MSLAEAYADIVIARTEREIARIKAEDGRTKKARAAKGGAGGRPPRNAKTGTSQIVAGHSFFNASALVICTDYNASLVLEATVATHPNQNS